MDFLIENNIIKQHRIIIDIGHTTTKIISCTYTKGEILINASKIISSEKFFVEGELTDLSELAREIKGLIKDKVLKNSEIFLALPPEVFYLRNLKK